MKQAPLIAGAIPALALAAASVVSLPIKLAYNGSPSAPIGFYWLDDQPIERGDYVVVRAPERVRTLVGERGYLPAGVPLIKRVAGLDGDEICRHGGIVSINGAFAAVAEKADGAGRPLPVWQGCIVLDAAQIFLLQDHPQSFDGRYIGAVDRRLVIGRATRLRFFWRKRHQD